jgi:hypothetical protein
MYVVESVGFGNCLLRAFTFRKLHSNGRCLQSHCSATGLYATVLVNDLSYNASLSLRPIAPQPVLLSSRVALKARYKGTVFSWTFNYNTTAKTELITNLLHDTRVNVTFVARLLVPSVAQAMYSFEHGVHWQNVFLISSMTSY